MELWKFALMVFWLVVIAYGLGVLLEQVLWRARQRKADYAQKVRWVTAGRWDGTPYRPRVTAPTDREAA